MKTDLTKDIKEKISVISSLIQSTRSDKLSDEGTSSIAKAKKLIAFVKLDGSGGIHNYMVLSSLLEQSIKDLKKLSAEQK